MEEYRDIVNIRDFKDITNKDGCHISKTLVRSSCLFNICDADLRKLYDLHDIRLIIDLRNSIEIIEKPDSLYKDMKHLKCSLQENTSEFIAQDKNSIEKRKLYFKELDKKCENEEYAFKHMSKFYYDLAQSNEFKSGMQLFFNTLLKEEHGILFHCSLGRDRCGVVSALLLLLLDVKKEDIFLDYLRSNQSIKSNRFYDLANSFYLEEFFRGLSDKYGNIDSFVLELELNKDFKTIIKKKYLEVI